MALGGDRLRQTTNEPISRGENKSKYSPGGGGWGNLPLPNTRRRCNKPNNKNKPSKPHNNSKPLRNSTLSITQINLKKKRNAWGTLLTNIHGRRNPIILASEPYANEKNHIPHVHKETLLLTTRRQEPLNLEQQYLSTKP